MRDARATIIETACRRMEESLSRLVQGMSNNARAAAPRDYLARAHPIPTGFFDCAFLELAYCPPCAPRKIGRGLSGRGAKRRMWIMRDRQSPITSSLY